MVKATSIVRPLCPTCPDSPLHKPFPWRSCIGLSALLNTLCHDYPWDNLFLTRLHCEYRSGYRPRFRKIAKFV